MIKRLDEIEREVEALGVEITALAQAIAALEGEAGEELAALRAAAADLPQDGAR